MNDDIPTLNSPRCTDGMMASNGVSRYSGTSPSVSGHRVHQIDVEADDLARGVLEFVWRVRHIDPDHQPARRLDVGGHRRRDRRHQRRLIASAGPDGVDVTVGPADAATVPSAPQLPRPERERRHQQHRGARDRQRPRGQPSAATLLVATGRMPPGAPVVRTGAFSARRAAAANSPAVWYRLPGFLAMPLAMTSSNAASFGSMADGCGTGALMCAAICCSRLSTG